MRRRTPAVAVLAAALALAGCGGGGSGGATEEGEGVAYDAAFDLCRSGLNATADVFAVEPTEDAVADVVVEQVAGGAPQDADDARRGCLDAIEAAEGP